MKIQKSNSEKKNAIKFNCIQPQLRASDGYLVLKSNSNFKLTNVKKI